MIGRRVLPLLVLVSLGLTPSLALAADDPAGEEAEPSEAARTVKPSTQLAAGMRLRYLYLPQGFLELWTGHATSLSSGGIGVELVRRRGDFELVFGLEYDNMEADPGLYLESGDNPAVPGQSPDYVTFNGLGLIGADITWTWGEKLTNRLEFRYGAGLGLAMVTGSVYQTDTQCGAQIKIGDLDDPGRCQRVGVAEKSDKVPPVFPIVNAVVGLRARVTDKITVDLEGGIHDTLFLGVKSGYAF